LKPVQASLAVEAPVRSVILLPIAGFLERMSFTVGFWLAPFVFGLLCGEELFDELIEL
jgi:hypothetical protein